MRERSDLVVTEEAKNLPLTCSVLCHKLDLFPGSVESRLVGNEVQNMSEADHEESS